MKIKLKAVIVDDEVPARSEMRYLLEKARVEVLGEAESAAEALCLLEAVACDVIFLDINLPGNDGLGLAEIIKKSSPQPVVVFTTAYAQFAVRAFELEAVDYLLKPISETRLKKALKRVENCLRAVPAETETFIFAGDKATSGRISITKEGKTIFISQEDIYYIKSCGEHSLINSKVGEFFSSLTLKEFSFRLSPKMFFRVHRGYIVNIDHVVEMTALSGGQYSLKLDKPALETIPVSRRQAKSLKHFLGLDTFRR